MQGFSYSDQLIDACIGCFREEDGIELTREQAEKCLVGLGGLFTAFAAVDRAATPHALACAGPPARLDK